MALEPEIKTPVRTLVVRLVLVTIGMFGFGFALVPLYDLFCDVTGLNGKTNAEAFVRVTELIDTSRQVTVQFVATNNEQMLWEFRPEVFKVKVHPGQEIETTFYARNPSSKEMVAQAIPSVSPGVIKLRGILRNRAPRQMITTKETIKVVAGLLTVDTK